MMVRTWRRKPWTSRMCVTLSLLFVFTINFYLRLSVHRNNDRADYFILESYPDHSIHPHTVLFWDLINKSSTQPSFTTKHVDTLTVPVLEPPSTATQPLIEELSVWPSLNNPKDDRILSQMRFRPKNFTQYTNTGDEIPLKKILLYNGYQDWGVKPGRTSFLEQNCPINTCELTSNRMERKSADAVLLRQHPVRPHFIRPPHQIWILYLLESPYFTGSLKSFRNVFNWTASYRHDSDIVAPYEKFVKTAKPNHSIRRPTRNYAEGKTKKVAWFASNCRAANLRLEFALELANYIEVDIYGKCGLLQCPRNSEGCSEMLNKDYKFYLAFENSNCRDYITEKFFWNGLQHDVIPIVMGAAPEDYYRVAPHYSFIHVDEYKDVKELADYLIELDQNDDLYNEYFRWKGTGTFINTYFWCRVCAMLHDTEREATSYEDIEEWWRGKDVCIGQHRWGQHPRTSPHISDYYKHPHRGLVDL